MMRVGHLFHPLLFLLIQQCISSYAFQLVTTSTIQGLSSRDLHNFLATPTNWPKIVASSHSVREVQCDSPNRIDVPLQVGGKVEEVFGLPPLLPLGVIWECVESSLPSQYDTEKIGKLEFYSAAGVSNLARNCKMKFEIKNVNDSVSQNEDYLSVRMEMEFELVSPLLLLGAAPILKLDNDFALKVLLPYAVTKRK